MTKQITLDEITAPEKFGYENEYFKDEDITVVCGVCGAAMKGGPQTTQMNKDNDIIGEWNYACRVCGEGAATLYVEKDDFGVMDNIEGQGNEAIKISNNNMEKRTINRKDSNGKEKEITAYFHKKHYNPTGWEEPNE